MSSQPIIIIGAGLAGLTLGRCLKHKGIPVIIYESTTGPRSSNYGITLHRSAYQSLLSVLEIDDSTFREKLAVDTSLTYRGQQSLVDASLTYRGHQSLDQFSRHRQDPSFRCHRGRLEHLLREGQDIKWRSQLMDVKVAPQSPKVTAVFQRGERAESPCLVGCDGPHSATRLALAPTMELKVLPYVVFNGSQVCPDFEYRRSIAPCMQDFVLVHKRKGDILLEISLNQRNPTTSDVNYTYSRPVRDGHDPLHNPNRTAAESIKIPKEFYKELEQLDGRFAKPFAKLFNPDNAWKNHVRHWLMRSLTPNTSEAQRLADQGVILIGDAIHATPILGGEGANLAMKDAIALADHIATEGVQGIGSFISPSRCEMWKRAVEDSEKRIEEMHFTNKLNL